MSKVAYRDEEIFWRYRMTQVIITRMQFEKLKEVFEMYDLDRVIWNEDHSKGAGIGSVTTIEFDPKQSIKMDITDVSSW